MNKKMKGLLIGVILVVVGLALLGVAMASAGFDFSRLSTRKYVENTYEVGEGFQHIQIGCDTEEIRFVLSEDGKCRVVCREDEKEPHAVKAAGDTLTIQSANDRKWHFLDFGIFFSGNPAVTVYLPEKAYQTLTLESGTGDVSVPADFTFQSATLQLSTGGVEWKASVEGSLSVQTSTGHIHLSDLTAESVQLKASTGGIRVEDVTCKGDMEISVSTGSVMLDQVSCRNLSSTGSTGSLTLSNTVASDSFTLKRSTGSIKFAGSDAETIYATASTGSITGTLRSEKVFIAQSNTGSVDVPKTITGGRCELSTSTGRIKIEIEE